MIELKPQFAIEQLVTPIFAYERIIEEGGKVNYIPVDRTPIKTGVDAFDALLREIEKGDRKAKSLAKKFGVTLNALNGFTFMLTGLLAHNFVRAYELRLIDLLLKHTDWSVKEMSVQFGFGTTGNVYQLLMRVHKQNIEERRNHIRERGDVGKFVFEKPSPQAVRKMKLLYLDV